MQQRGGGKSIDVGCYTLPGNRYGDLNQDYSVVQRFVSPHSGALAGTHGFVGAVLDGHGMLGERVAEKAGDALVHDLCNNPKLRTFSELSEDVVKALLKDSFRKSHDAALQVYDDPPETVFYPGSYPRNNSLTAQAAMEAATYRLQPAEAGTHMYRGGGRYPAQRMLECGTTCTLAVVQGGRVAVANVGDSPAIIGSLEDEPAVRTLTIQHNGCNPLEAQRIKDGYGEFARIVSQGYLSVRCGSWAGYELAVTRALGHKHMSNFGVTCDPHVTVHDLAPEDQCMIIGSDGLWEALTPKDALSRVATVINNGGSAQDAAYELVQDAVALSLAGMYHEADNTSAVVMLL